MQHVGFFERSHMSAIPGKFLPVAKAPAGGSEPIKPSTPRYTAAEIANPVNREVMLENLKRDVQVLKEKLANRSAQAEELLKTKVSTPDEAKAIEKKFAQLNFEIQTISRDFGVAEGKVRILNSEIKPESAPGPGLTQDQISQVLDALRRSKPSGPSWNR
jgi:hypothetical protein